ncbi:MAG TPA: hypothetical protein VM290_02440, partial [Gaiellaceae bacterium]|nr:hypothetical protein [Gaiellaceae bacterium]
MRRTAILGLLAAAAVLVAVVSLAKALQTAPSNGVPEIELQQPAQPPPTATERTRTRPRAASPSPTTTERARPAQRPARPTASPPGTAPS